MRINRISVRDFRGVDTLDVEFDPSGVTIIEGRNGIGKTSLADAFMLLLDYKDSSTSKPIKDVQPIGRDVGPFVEAHLTVGPYRLVYRKQWAKGKKTELEIIEPRREQLAGEAAHNRMLEILENETDADLFRALRYQQGVAISQAAVGQAPSLIAALDAAAGGTGTAGGARQDAHFERVEQERLKYFTEKGALPVGRKDKATQLEELLGEVAAVGDRIRILEDAAERQGRIESELVDLKAQVPEIASQINDSTKTVEAIEEVERRVERTRHEHERAESELREAIAARDVRMHLVGAAASAAATLATIEADIASAAPGLEAAKAVVADAEQARDAARAALASVEQEAADRRRVVELLDLRRERDQFRERHERVVAAEATIEAAEQFLARCAVDDALLRQIDGAADALAVAKGRAAAGKPRLVLEALQPVHVVVNGEGRTAEPGVPLEEIVTGEVEVIIGDVARVSVLRPESTSDAEDDLVRAEKQLAELLDASGVTSQSEAHDLVRERSRHETERDNARQRREDDLFDLDLPQLAAKLGRAEERLVALEAEEDAALAGVELLEEARVRAQEADGSVRDARSVESDRQTTLAAAESALRVLEDRGIEQQTRLDGARVEAERSARELEKHRGVTSDDELEKVVEVIAPRVTDAAGDREAAERELASGDPETARAMLENAQKLQERVLADTRAREIESAETRKHLELEGHEGLSDRLAEARAKVEDLQRDIDSENARAAAVERLHAILSEKREQAHQTYIGPFREKVNAYARILYGPQVDVEIDPLSFEVVTGTLNGSPVPFASLSGGEREQLAVLTRLACGALVSPAAGDGTPRGVPVIIDDALGYSDPDRLEKLGAAFSVAGKDCQVIVLTCEPGRYRGVGGAKVVPLG